MFLQMFQHGWGTAVVLITAIAIVIAIIWLMVKVNRAHIRRKRKKDPPELDRLKEKVAKGEMDKAAYEKEKQKYL